MYIRLRILRSSRRETVTHKNNSLKISTSSMKIDDLINLVKLFNSI